MASITIDGLNEEVFRRNIEAMLRVGEADRAAAKLRALIEPFAGEGKILPARFLEISAADIELVGWEKLGERLARNDRPRHRISALTIAVADLDALDLDAPFKSPMAPKAAPPIPLIATSHYTDEAFPFSDSGMADLLDGYTFYGCEWHGSSAHMDLALSLSGVEDLYAAVAALEAELIASRGPPVDKIRAGSLASCYLSVLLFQAVRKTIRTKGVPRALCVTAGNEGVYPYFDAPVIGSAECIEQGLVAELMVDAVAVAEDATVPMASLADLVPVSSDGAAIGAGLSADDESFGYHRLLGMTGRRSEKKPVLELAEADLRSAAEMLERAGEERMGSRPDNTGDELLAHHAAPRGLAVPAGEWAEPDVFADPRMFHELIGPRRSAPAASENCGEADPGEAGSGEPQAESTGPIWTDVAWRAPEAGDAAVDLQAAESDLEEGTGWAGHGLTQSLANEALDPALEVAADLAPEPAADEPPRFQPPTPRSHSLRSRITEAPPPPPPPPLRKPAKNPFAAINLWLRRLLGLEVIG